MKDDSQNSTLLRVLFYLGAILSFIISFIVFFKTMAPTVSFWDCGEFIASSHILGVPHPPGTPLFILIGRFFIILSIFSTSALNTNFISVLSSSIAIVVAYFIIVKVSEFIINHDKNNITDILISRIGIYIGALSGSLIMAFSSTFWFNAVESEVYGLSMLLMLIITLMLIKWAKGKLDGGNDVLLIGIVYLLFLSISIHLTTFSITPAIVLFTALVDREKARDWRFWVCWGILFSFASPVYLPVQLMIPTLLDYQIETWMFLMLAFTAYCGFKAFNNKGKAKHKWSFYFALMVVAVIGFTPHIYIPIRASQKPAINENNPDNWSRVKSYLERKQYGQESMITRMFTRRGKIENQFGDYPHMGYWGYFKEQYSNVKWGMLRYLPFLMGLFGIYISLRKSFKNGFLLAVIFLISSLGLILYLNFADGTKADHLEVRDRDYFFTPAFIYFAILIGIGFSALLSNILTWLRGKTPVGISYLIWAAMVALIILMPLDTLSYHYKTHDRTGDYPPPDYAYNILNSCEQDAIIFTNGDNDTFPLWYLQEVENVRKDVRVINLSLLNTDWYILQLKNQMGVPITLTDEQIQWELYERKGQIKHYRPKKPFYDPIRKRSRFLVAYSDPKSGKINRVQDQMIEHIVLANKWQYPIYFSTSVPGSNRWTLSDYTLRQAMVLRIMPNKTEEKIDPVRTEELLFNVYKYRGIKDINVFKDDNNVGLTTTYPERFIELATYYANHSDSAKARNIYRESLKRFPHYYQTYIDLINLYKNSDSPDSAKYFYELGIENLQSAVEAWPNINLYWQFLGVLYFNHKDYENAISCYEKSLDLDPSSSISFRLLLQLYSYSGNKGKGLVLLEEWLEDHPDDMDARNMYQVYKRYNR
ncbi:MAG: DUF2723 domain-containing protein [candidate division Zixibacteria bacterium]|nr:DUF2723 domain-containing protein [candidate division Zixibacteria bacterium]